MVLKGSELPKAGSVEYNPLWEGNEVPFKTRVVLAEDHILVREGTRQLLEREKDLEVVGEAADGVEAVKLAKELRPDVVVMDIAMPNLNGIEATRQIKALSPSTAVLVLSAYDDDAYVFAVLEAGAAGYLLKTMRGSQLVDAIRAVKQGESVLHPTIAKKVIQRLVSSPEKPSTKNGDELTPREMEVLKLAAKGHSNSDIAKALVLSRRTVQAHLGNIFSKLKVGSRTEAVISALRLGLIRMEDLT